jgi:ribosomal-protein-alanine acetyltransferase
VAREGEDGAAAAAVSIRKYTSADLPAVLSICRQCPEAAQWSENGFAQAYLSGQMILVAEVAGEIPAEVAARVCGFLAAQVTIGEAELLNMAVDDEHRRKGLGSKLLAVALKEALSKQAARMYLEVRESNLAAISFYARHGFRKSGQRAGYYLNPTENAVLMEKLTD